MSSESGPDVAIDLRGVSKKYRLFESHKDRLLEAIWPRRKRHKDFWALRDLDLVIRRGETVGILGRNGSGKSTLLQLIAGILEPSDGDLTVRGRVSALLELGAGFNPEFSGRENVVMNGLFLGLSAEEMRTKIPEIEAFADVGEFFDRPVRTYSSGMFVRVAFAAAVMINPEVLIIDEALAVGDIRFQHKCYQRMKSLQLQGVTILFVTHDVHAIAKHASRGIILENGMIIDDGSPVDVVQNYTTLLFEPAVGAGSCVYERDFLGEDTSSEEGQTFSDPITCRSELYKSYNTAEVRYGDGRAEIFDYAIITENSENAITITPGDTISISFSVHFKELVSSPMYGFAVYSLEGILLYGKNTIMLGCKTQQANPGDVVTAMFTFLAPFAPMDLFIDLGCGELIDNSSIPLDRRQRMIHLRCESENDCEGIMESPCTFTVKTASLR